jgi:hypothetical protein
MKPGNAGGGKDPDFWNASKDGEDRVIGDESGNTTKDQGLSEGAALHAFFAEVRKEPAEDLANRERVMPTCSHADEMVYC